MEEVNGRRSPSISSSLLEEDGLRLLSEGQEPREVQAKGWRGWCGRSVKTLLKGSASLAIFGAGIGLRVTDPTPISKVFSTVMIGVGFQAAVNCCFKNKYTSRVQQASLTVSGAVSVFLISQIWGNIMNDTGQKICTSNIGAILGIHIALYGKQFIQSHFAFRHESDSQHLPEENKPKFTRIFPPSLDWFKAVKSTACLAGWILTTQFENYKEPVLTGLFSFGTVYYAADILSQRFAKLVQRKIKESNVSQYQTSNLRKLSVSPFRVLKTTINTLGFFSILVWCPFTVNPRTPERSSQMWIAGLVSGLFDGFAFQCQETRFKNLAIEELDELQPRQEIENKAAKTAFRVGKVAWIGLALGGLAAFFASQMPSSELEPDDKYPLACMYASFMATFVKNWRLSNTWSLDKRKQLAADSLSWKDRLKDYLVVSKHLQRDQILGINPLFIYLLFTNSIAMHNGQDLNRLHRTLFNVAWWFYGTAMAEEFDQTLSEERGTVFRRPMMAVMNALLTLRSIWLGLIE